jgi:hypothetical protein
VSSATTVSGVVPGPVAGAVRKGVEAGTAIGELVDFGISWWWDPHVEVFPVDPNHIVFGVTNSELTSIADGLIKNLSVGSPFNTTLSDLKALNEISPGMGDSAINLLFASSRAFIDTAQGAAAFAVGGVGSAPVLEAAENLNNDLTAFRMALVQYSSYVVAYDDVPGFPVLTSIDYMSFLSDVKNNAALALPSGEVAVGQQLFTLAGVYMRGSTLDASLVEYLSEGDTSHEVALFPQQGFTTSALLTSGASTFDTDVNQSAICGCMLCTPEPSSFYLLSAGTLVLCAYACIYRKLYLHYFGLLNQNKSIANPL